MKAYLIHRWGGNPESDWYSWLKEELTKLGYKVIIPLMPNTEEPKIGEWVEKLEEISPEENSILIGHSVGCQTILRFLKKTNKTFKAVFLVAPWTKLKPAVMNDEESAAIARPWIEASISWEIIKSKTNNFTVFFSDDDPYVYLDNSKLFQENLNAKIIVENNKGHFDEDTEITEFPTLLKEVESL